MRKHRKISKSTVLTVASCVGVFVTAFTSSKAGIKASKALNEANFEPSGNKLDDFVEKYKIIWKDYLLTDISVLLTIAAIVGNHHLTKRQITAIAAAAGCSGRLVKEYSDKIAERFGMDELNAIRGAIAMDHRDGIQKAQVPCIISDNFVDTTIDCSVPGCDELFYDIWNDSWFWGNMANVKTAQYHLNRNFILRGYASLAEYFEFLGIDAPDKDIDYTMLGWGDEFITGGCSWIDFTTTKRTDEHGRDYWILSYVYPPEDLSEDEVY